MSYHIVPLEGAHIPAAVDLFAAAYEQERVCTPLLPPVTPALRARVDASLRDALPNPGVAAFSGPHASGEQGGAGEAELLGYMVTCAQFDWKGQRTALVLEYAHASIAQGKDDIYRALYAALGEALVARGAHLQIVCHLAGDTLLTNTLFQLGFGAVVAERLRDLSDVSTPAQVEIIQEGDFRTVAPLASEHARYYRGSPIFMIKDDSATAIDEELERHRRDGDALLVYREGGDPRAYCIVGRCSGKEEGFLLRGTSTAQILSTYAAPAARGRGIGKALLQHAVAWARGQGYERLMVEHETANPLGARFWSSHFGPYLYASMRYVDCSL